MGTAEKIPASSPKVARRENESHRRYLGKPDDFAKAAKNLGKAAGELAAAAKAKDDAEIGVKVKALGDARGACHKAFRAESTQNKQPKSQS
jgi:cytochrome c556